MVRTLVFSSKVYGVETIKKAAYRFSDVLSIDIVVCDETVECTLHFTPGSKEEGQADQIVAAFRNEVLDQDLRSIIGKETEGIRNAVLAFAFSKTGLQERE